MKARAVQVTGGSTYTVSLPNEWATANISCRSTLEDAVVVLVEDDDDITHDVIERDDDVDHLWLVVSRTR